MLDMYEGTGGRTNGWLGRWVSACSVHTRASGSLWRWADEWVDVVSDGSQVGG